MGWLSKNFDRRPAGSALATLRLTAYRLAILRLVARITSFDPRTRYPVAGQPSGTGFTPARIYGLCPAALGLWLIFFFHYSA